jgi:hypothetical protein
MPNGTKYTKLVKMYTKWYKSGSKCIPNGQKYTIPRPSKVYINVDFGLKIYHLATLSERVRCHMADDRSVT